MHKSQMTIKTSLTSLEKSELILRKRQGVGQPNRIYVKFPLGTFHHTDKILSLTQTENCPSNRQNSITETDKKLSTNKKEREKNNLSKNERAKNLSPYG